MDFPAIVTLWLILRAFSSGLALALRMVERFGARLWVSVATTVFSPPHS